MIAWTIAHEIDDVLKPDAHALDTCHGMRTQDLKLRIERANYEIDPAVVAEAMLRRAVSYRRCWNPRTDLTVPADLSSTFGGPSRTLPIQVSGAADCAA